MKDLTGMPVWRYTHFKVRPVAYAMFKAKIIGIYCPRFNNVPSAKLIDEQQGIMEFWGIVGFANRVK